jgi:hypothetical protein
VNQIINRRKKSRQPPQFLYIRSSSYLNPNIGKDLKSLHQARNLAAAVHLGSTNLVALLRPDPGVRLDHPFVPDLCVVCLPPHADFQLGVLREVEGFLNPAVSIK